MTMTTSRVTLSAALIFLGAILLLALLTAGTLSQNVQDFTDAMVSGGNTVDTAVTHGVRHFSAADIRTCLDQNGPLQVWFDPVTKKQVNVCKLDDGIFGLQFVIKRDGAWREITAFVKDRINSLGGIGNYLRGCGYQILPK